MIFARGAPKIRQVLAWESMWTKRTKEQAFQSINELPGKGPNDPQLDWDIEGNMIVRATGHKIIRGVALIDVLDVDNANLNRWFVQPRATTDEEKRAGLIRVCKL